MSKDEIKHILDEEEENCVHRMFTTYGVKMRVAYAKWYYTKYGDCLQENKTHWTQTILNPFCLGIIDVVDSILSVFEKRK